MLLIDTNILVRCSIGRALQHVTTLRDRDVEVATTVHNVDELYDRLANKFMLAGTRVDQEIRRVLEPIKVVGAEDYDHLRGAADARLRAGGKSDWPALAAALAFEADIWSEDVDFFGVGVPVWTTANVRFFGVADAR